MTWPLLGAVLLGLVLVLAAVKLGRWLERDAAIVVHDQVDTSVVLQTAHAERERAMTPLPYDPRLRPLRPMPEGTDREREVNEKQKAVKP